MVQACISQDLSWAEPAKKWEGVFEEVYAYPSMSPGTGKKSEVQVPVARV